ncbi:MAG: hypothetical protein Q7S70_01700 [bacterium]|nr:hypothetical protein [bacterium]
MNGYIALISILIISAVLLITAVGSSLLSISEANIGLKKSQGSEVFYSATACAEEALQKIRESPSFSGSGNLAVGEGNCGYAVENLGDQNRLVTASGTIQNATGKIKIAIDQVLPNIHITSWQQSADF